MKRILVIDDERQICEMLRKKLESVGYAVAEAPNGKVGLKLHKENLFDLIITDIFMPEKEGLETIRELKQDFPQLKIIAITGASSKITHFPLPENDPVRRKPDITLAKEKLGWQPTTPLEEGLERTIGYFSSVMGE